MNDEITVFIFLLFQEQKQLEYNVIKLNSDIK